MGRKHKLLGKICGIIHCGEDITFLFNHGFGAIPLELNLDNIKTNHVVRSLRVLQGSNGGTCNALQMGHRNVEWHQ